MMSNESSRNAPFMLRSSSVIVTCFLSSSPFRFFPFFFSFLSFSTVSRVECTPPGAVRPTRNTTQRYLDRLHTQEKVGNFNKRTGLGGREWVDEGGRGRGGGGGGDVRTGSGRGGEIDRLIVKSRSYYT